MDSAAISQNKQKMPPHQKRRKKPTRPQNVTSGADDDSTSKEQLYNIKIFK